MRDYLTVSELVEKLNDLDPEAKVKIEGCDCIGVANGVDSEFEIKYGYILITRGTDDDDDDDD
jgi:hypothetical protein